MLRSATLPRRPLPPAHATPVDALMASSAVRNAPPAVRVWIEAMLRHGQGAECAQVKAGRAEEREMAS